MTDTQVRTSQDVLEIVVNLDDIATGEPSSVNECAVAQALRRAGEPNPQVCQFVLAYGRVWTQSDELRDWIGRFDRGESVAPERFVLQPDRRFDNNPAG